MNRCVAPRFPIAPVRKTREDTPQNEPDKESLCGTSDLRASGRVWAEQGRVERIEVM
jgi:hypothetical protein